MAAVYAELNEPVVDMNVELQQWRRKACSHIIAVEDRAGGSFAGIVRSPVVDLELVTFPRCR